MYKRILMTCLAIAMMCPIPAMASLYLGASIGNSWYSSKVEVEEIESEIKDISDNSTGWKIFGGFNSQSFFSVEGGYRDLGTVETTVQGTTLTKYDSKTKGWDIQAMGRLQIAIVDLFGKAGAFFYNTQGDWVDESGTAFIWGLGAGVHFGPIGVRLEWESMEVKNPDTLSMVSLGATFGF